jgi:hypothetical protein
MEEPSKLQFMFTRASAGWRRGAMSVIAVPDDDAYGPYYPFARYCWYGHDKPDEDRWADARLEICVHAMTHFKRPDVDRRRYCVASAEGDVVFLEDPQDTYERIPGAGIEQPDSRFWGRIYGMRAVGQHLYACGEGRQLYRRSDAGEWICMAPELLNGPDTPIEQDSIIYCLDGPDENEMYAVDSRGTILFWNGRHFRELANVGAVRLIDIEVEDAKTIWIGGSRGTLLRGNHVDGFRQVPGIDGNQNFSSLARHEGRMYLASNAGGWDVGPYVYDDGRLERVVTGLEPENTWDAHTVCAGNGDLWFVGLKDILYHDGHRWERIDFPGNTPIR